MDYKNTTIWKYIIAKRNNHKDTKKLHESIKNKYLGTGVEMFPIPYELGLLAAEIVGDPSFKGVDEFLHSLSGEEWEAVYEAGLDSEIMKRAKEK